MAIAIIGVPEPAPFSCQQTDNHHRHNSLLS